MKRIVIVAVLFLICVGVSAYTIFYVNEINDRINFCVDGALQAIADANEEQLISYVDDLSSYWNDQEDRMIHYIRHAAIDDITKSVARLQPLAAGEDYSELAAELSSIQWQMDHIYRSETKFLANLL